MLIQPESRTKDRFDRVIITLREGEASVAASLVEQGLSKTKLAEQLG